MMNQLVSTAAAADLIRQGRALAIAGPQGELQQLPTGRWIGGTTPYFMLTEGGTVSKQGAVFVTDLSDLGEVTVAYHAADDLAGIVRDAPANGFAYAVIPAGSTAHRRYAADAPGYPDAFVKPTVGWISGVHLDDLGRVDPKVFDGRNGVAFTDGAIVAYVAMPAHQMASIEIINPFEPDAGDVIRFDDTTFSVRDCQVNGERVAFADYVRERRLADGHTPLVGDFAGAHVNASIQSVGADGVVHLYAPVFSGVDYHVARELPDFAATFRRRLGDISPDGVVLGCNCILNFLHGKLEGKAIGGVAGPVTFGEIAYQLLNQTLVMVRVV